eukprot:5057542-Prymnesium_polylepis.1
MATRYRDLSPVVLFLKDTSYKDGWTVLKKRQHTLPLMAAQATAAHGVGFSCRMARRHYLMHNFSVWHLWEALGNFHSNSYATQHDQGNRTRSFTSPHRPMSKWLVRSGIFGRDETAPEKPAFEHLLSQSVWPVCFGGGFAATRRGIHRWPKAVWERLSTALTRGDSIEEGHYVERLWAALLVPPLSVNATREVMCASAGRDLHGSHSLGMLTQCRCTSRCNVSSVKSNGQ